MKELTYCPDCTCCEKYRANGGACTGSFENVEIIICAEFTPNADLKGGKEIEHYYPCR